MKRSSSPSQRLFSKAKLSRPLLDPISSSLAEHNNEFKNRLESILPKLKDAASIEPIAIRISIKNLREIYVYILRNPSLWQSIDSGTGVKISKEESGLNYSSHIFRSITGELDIILATKSKYIDSKGEVKKNESLKIIAAGTESEIQQSYNISRFPIEEWVAAKSKLLASSERSKSYSIMVTHPKKLKQEAWFTQKTEPPIIVKKYYGGSYAAKSGKIKSVSFMPKAQCDLRDLFSRSEELENLKFSDILVLIYTVTQRVVGLHHLGYIHRDIKPDNILIFPDKSGFPSPLIADTSHCIPTSEAKYHKIIGTVGFFPLESLDEMSHPSEWHDVYALAETLRWCLQEASKAKKNSFDSKQKKVISIFINYCEGVKKQSPSDNYSADDVLCFFDGCLNKIKTVSGYTEIQKQLNQQHHDKDIVPMDHKAVPSSVAPSKEEVVPATTSALPQSSYRSPKYTPGFPYSDQPAGGAAETADEVGPTYILLG